MAGFVKARTQAKARLPTASTGELFDVASPSSSDAKEVVNAICLGDECGRNARPVGSQLVHTAKIVVIALVFMVAMKWKW